MGVTTAERDRIQAPEREVRELRQAHEILRQGRRRILPRRSLTAAASREGVS